MSRKGGLIAVVPRAGYFKPPRWGDRAIGKRQPTPPRKRPLAGPPRGAVAISRGRDGGKSTDVPRESKSPGTCEVPGDENFGKQ